MIWGSSKININYWEKFKQKVVNDARPNIKQILTFDYKEKLLWTRFEELAEINGLVFGWKIRDGGHLSFETTFIKLKTKRFYWPRIKEKIKLTCANFVLYGARKITTHALKGTLISMAANFPFERIAMGIVKILPNTTRNNRYMLVVIDYYICWPKAFALDPKDAHSVALWLISKIISRYGAPYVIHTDQGTNLESKLIAKLCKLFDITKTRTTQYHPQSNRLVERLNITLFDKIDLIAKDAQDTWNCSNWLRAGSLPKWARLWPND